MIGAGKCESDTEKPAGGCRGEGGVDRELCSVSLDCINRGRYRTQ